MLRHAHFSPPHGERFCRDIGNPSLTQETQDALLAFANGVLPAVMANWQKGPYRAMRQNALRMLILTSSDFQTS